MRILGPNTALDEFRLDLVHLHARLRADKNTALQALAERVTPAREALLADRAALESAEEQLTIAQAVVSARDAALDDEEKRFALAAKLAGAEATLFTMAPSKMIRAPLDEQIQLTRDQLTKLDQRADGDELRTTWSPVLRAALDALTAARDAKSTEQSDLAGARSLVAQRKSALDAFRVEMWGLIAAEVKDKSVADGFYRSKPRSRGKTDPAPAPVG